MPRCGPSFTRLNTDGNHLLSSRQHRLNIGATLCTYDAPNETKSWVQTLLLCMASCGHLVVISAFTKHPV